MKAKLFAVVLVFIINFRICQSKKYDKFTLFSVVPNEVDHLKFLQNLEKQRYIDIVFWRRPMKLFHQVEFIVNPADKDLFLERVRHFNMKANMLLTDLQVAFENQTVRRYQRLRVDNYSWDYYHTLEDIYQWMSDLAKEHEDLVELVSIGKSVEGRDIFALLIKRSRAKHRAIVEGGIHGNEWISTEFITYLAYQLITCNKTNSRLFKLAHGYEWHLIPVVNPDGYDYSHNVDRLFMKNRNLFNGSSGVNLNRNFDYNFRKYATSDNIEDDYYGGRSAFSEPETKALKKIIEQTPNLKFYFAIHGYGQKIIIPYADRVNHVEDYTEMENYGKQAILKMYKLYGRKYSVGTFYDTMGVRLSGNSASWVKKNHRVKYVFTLLLRDNGTYGYALPSSEILPACKEALIGLVEIMRAKPRRVRADMFNSSRSLNFLIVLILSEVLMLVLK